MSGRGIVIVEWRQVRKGALCGFAKIRLASGIMIYDVPVLTGPNGPWATPPAKLQIDRDGHVIKDGDGKVRYQTLIDFVDRETRNRWSQGVIDALTASHPEAFTD